MHLGRASVQHGHRFGATACQRHLDATQLEHSQRVARGVLEAIVAIDRRNTDEIEMPRREQQRNRIVVTGIAVDQEFLLWHCGLSSIKSIATPFGKLGAAPTRVHAILAATHARRMAGSISNPRSKAAASTPTKQSPAPVVSTTFTGMDGTCQLCSPVTPIAPSAPSVTITVVPSSLEMGPASPAGAADAWPMCVQSWLASCSLRTRTSTCRSAVSSTGRAGARLRMTRAPRALATATPLHTSPLGISICSTSQSPHARISGRSASALVKRLAPEAT